MSMEEYAQKKAAFDQVNRERQGIINTLEGLAGALRENPDGFHFSNIEGGFPAEVIFGRNSPSFDGRRWPSAQNIQNALVQWHQARQEMHGSWDRLTPEQKGAMQPPPGRPQPVRR